MDAPSLCRACAQFGFDVAVREQDGADERHISLQATRVNGIDAGWLAHSELLGQIREAAGAAALQLRAWPVLDLSLIHI